MSFLRLHFPSNMLGRPTENRIDENTLAVTENVPGNGWPETPVFIAKLR